VYNIYMPRIQLYLGKEEHLWAKGKPRGFLRRIIARERRNEQKGIESSSPDKPNSNQEMGE